MSLSPSLWLEISSSIICFSSTTFQMNIKNVIILSNLYKHVCCNKWFNVKRRFLLKTLTQWCDVWINMLFVLWIFNSVCSYAAASRWCQGWNSFFTPQRHLEFKTWKFMERDLVLSRRSEVKYLQVWSLINSFLHRFLELVDNVSWLTLCLLRPFNQFFYVWENISVLVIDS